MAGEPLALEAATALAVEEALDANAGAAEAYGEDAAGREIRVYEEEVESLTSSLERGVGVRAWLDGRVGYAYGTDLSQDGLRELARGAVEAAGAGDSDEFAVPPPKQDHAALEGIHDPALARWTSERKLELAVSVDRAARGSDPRVSAVEQSVYADSEDRVVMSASNGFAGSYEATSCYAYVQAFAGEGSERMTGLGFGVGRSPEALDPEAIGREAGRRAGALVGASKPVSRSCPVVLDQTVAGSFIGLIGTTLGADAVQRGRSPFAERLGEQIADPVLVLSDDGLEPEGFASGPFDDEGIARRRTPLIEQGRLRSFLYDSYTAGRAGGESTGNAGRGGYRSPPSVSASNLVVDDGDDDLEALFRAAGEGLYVTDVAGLHSGVNPISGQFSVGASGHLIAGGATAEPVRELTIASDLTSMLRAVRRVGREGRWVPFAGSVRAPALLIGEMTVSGA